MAGMDLNPPSIYYTAVIIFKGAGVQHSNYTLFFKKDAVANGQKCRDLNGNPGKKKKSLGREVLSEGALTGFRHHLNTLKDQPIKTSNARFYFTACTDAEFYI